MNAYIIDLFNGIKLLLFQQLLKGNQRFLAPMGAAMVIVLIARLLFNKK